MSIFVFFLLYAHKHTHACLISLCFLGVFVYFFPLLILLSHQEDATDVVTVTWFFKWHSFNIFAFKCCSPVSPYVCFSFFLLFWYLFFCVCTRVFVLVCVYVWMGSTFSCSFTCCVSISLEILCIRNLLFASVSMRKFYNRNKYSTRLKTTI